MVEIDKNIFSKMYGAKHKMPGTLEFKELAEYYRNQYALYLKYKRMIDDRDNPKANKRVKKTQNIKDLSDEKTIDAILSIKGSYNLKVKNQTRIAVDKAIKVNGVELDALLKNITLDIIPYLDIIDCLIHSKTLYGIRPEVIVDDDTIVSKGRKPKPKFMLKTKNKVERDGHISFRASTIELLRLVKKYKILDWDQTICYLIELYSDAKYHEYIKLLKQYNSKDIFIWVDDGVLHVCHDTDVKSNEESSKRLRSEYKDVLIRETDIDNFKSFIHAYRTLKNIE